MWIVRLALARPYTFVVLALLILILAPVVILRTPTDIFPNIDIPVIASAFNYTGLSAEEMEERIASIYERSLTTTVNDIEHMESQSINGRSIIKIFFQPGADVKSAIAEVTAISQPVLRQMPPGTTAPFLLAYSASSVPILQLGLGGQGLSEQELFDYGVNFIRTRLVTIPGCSIPYPYGGKQRQIMVDIDPTEMQSKGLSPADITNAIANQNLIIPAGTSKIGQFEYDVDLNSSPETVDAFNDFPIKVVNGTPVYIRDVGHVRDGFSPQTNIVRQDGKRGVLLTIMKAGNASTLSVVDGVRKMLPVVAATLPPELKMQPLADQSIFVRASINGVIREAVIAACLTGLMILVFLGSWRSTVIIAVSIPLSILTSIIVLSLLHETINIMTLGGLALAVGILVDDATVEIENVNRNLDQGKEIEQAILDGASQIAVPAMVSTLCICIVFLPMFFLSGVARYLFVPLAEAVVFAMLASYGLSRTLVPTLAKYLLKRQHHGPSRNPLVLLQRAFEHGFDRLRDGYYAILNMLVHGRWVFVPLFLVVCLSGFLLFPWLGQDFFPSSDTGQFKLHLRAKMGMRIEETARICDLVEQAIRRQVPPDQLENILDEIGLPYSSINTIYSNSAPVGTSDADIMVALKENHRPTEEFVRMLRASLPREFPGTEFYFLPDDIVSQILNFGLPAPIDVQLIGKNVEANRDLADRMLRQMRRVPGIADLRIQQTFDQPMLHVFTDRIKAAQSGYTQADIAQSLLISLSGSFQTAPTFWLNPQNGVSYSVVTQAPQYDVDSLQGLRNLPLTAGPTGTPEILNDLTSISRGDSMSSVNHYDIQRTIDIYSSVDGRDLAAVGRDVQSIVNQNRKNLVRGSEMLVRGQVETMQTSFAGLVAGLIFSIVLVYLLIVVNFQSWLDPFIIITALPAALAGIVLMLFVTHTTLSVPAMMGAIMCMGVATANSILVISFAKERLIETGNPVEAALSAGFTRFRPVIMTALAMMIGMVPMARGLGEGGEQNAPLGRAVIGGLLFATVATLTFVPAIFAMLHGRRAPSQTPEGTAND
ncbi:MAG TPA: efflux RND transporter permease subunit [Bryobacteraceae bacterium]|jgi:multidrug efflux pump subunit AcrB|nr:efflux RND transporter permease subunit [Bryobacteraceae bacterium]